LVVILLEFAISILEATPWFEAQLRPDRDRFMQSFIGRVIRSDSALRLAFIDIDDEAYKAWGERLITDRSRLVRLIDYAVQGGASSVVVDVELTHPSDSDNALRNYVATYSSPAPLIFLRTFETPVSDRIARNIRPTILDGVSAKGAPIYFASTSFIRDSDEVVRGWRLWEPVCRDGVPAAIPSVELLMLSIADGPNGPARLEKSLETAIGGGCSDLKEVRSADFKSMKRAAVDLFPDEIGERILYTIPWPLIGQPTLTLNGIRSSLVEHLPALPIVENDPAPDRIQGRIAIIGGSNADSRDFYLTPIGVMPGAMVILNSINSLLQQGQLRGPPWLVATAFSLLLGMCVWLCLFVFQFAIAVVIATVVVAAMTWTLSLSWIASGIWFDLGIPMFGIFMHRWITVIDTLLYDRHEYGWRAVLTPTFRRSHRASRPIGSERDRSVTSIVLIAVAMGMSVSAFAAEKIKAGYISEIAGVSNNVTIERGGERLRARYWMEILDGDRISVQGNGRIKIEMDGGAQPLIVSRQTSPASITARDRRRGLPLQGLDWLSKVLTGWSDERATQREIVEAKIRDPLGNADQPLALPLLHRSGRTQRIIAGASHFSIGWVGGIAPFEIVLLPADGEPTFKTHAGENRIAASDMYLNPGEYQVRIVDSTGAEVQGRFEVSEARPSMDDRDLQQLPQNLLVMISAARLADAEGGAWHLEAYERLADQGRRNLAAQVLAERLAQGLSISDLLKR
jgi:CHASE2 domain-containing sensor protein